MKRSLLGTLLLTILIVTGVVHGYWTERWAVSEAVSRGAASLDLLPYKIGDWEGEPLDVKATPQRGVEKQLYRRYRNQKTGDEVSVAIVCGRPGPVCIHTPDVCYGASGYKVGNKTDVPVKYAGGTAEFFTADAVKEKAVETTALRIFWSWNVRGKWRIDASPRRKFGAGRGVLYKLYVIRDLNAPTELRMDPCADFLQQALPVFDKTLVTE